METRRITSFIKNILRKQGFKKVVIGLSGGVDSATSFYLLKEVIPPQNIIVAHLYYFESEIDSIKKMLSDAKIPKENIYEIPIAPMVKSFNIHLGGIMASQAQPATSEVTGTGSSKVRLAEANRVRLGNIMARVRMIILFDIAKKNNALVCGTENKSESLLGYFTRFGDEASDIEPIQHLYKTQVYGLAKYLGVPREIIEKAPTAGLWTDQTDENDFGFSYKEADLVLHFYYEKKMGISALSKDFPNAKKIIAFFLKNSYKHHTPYKL